MCSTLYCGFRSSSLVVLPEPLHRSNRIRHSRFRFYRSYAGSQITHTILFPCGSDFIVKWSPCHYVGLACEPRLGPGFGDFLKFNFKVPAGRCFRPRLRSVVYRSGRCGRHPFKWTLLQAWELFDTLPRLG